MKHDRLVLVGMSGAGKSTVGRALADRLGWRLIDLDAEIERREGRSIPDIFGTSGEAAFRAIEREVFRAALADPGTVIATGGGAVVNDAAWQGDMLGAEHTLSLLLDAPPEELFRRLTAQQAQDPDGAVRPMLASADPLARIQALITERAPFYRRANAVLPVMGRAVDDIVSLLESTVRATEQTIALDVPGGSSRIHVGTSQLGTLGVRIAARWPQARRVWIVADEQVAAHHLDRAVDATTGDAAEVRTVTFPSGEGSKSLDGVGSLYDALLHGGIERTDVIVALGGGVAGDLVGFAAATVLRGVGLVQVPTSLLAMVDSSVGGKTGINHATGKNLIGAFYQPPVVLIDPDLLATLPERQYRSGWAEIIKHGLIEPSTPAGDSGLFDLVTANATALRERRSPLIGPVIARNVDVKASVVRADEREAGLRAILNFGHTIGHAVEAAGYRLLHGEAVAVGLHAAMRLGEALGHVPAERVEAVVDALTAFGLPTQVEADPNAVLRLMRSDKKRVAGEQRWIVPRPEGGVAIEAGIPEAAVESALQAVVGGEAG